MGRKVPLGIVIVICLLIGGGASYGIIHLIYQPQIEDYQSQVDRLTTDVAGLQAQYEEIANITIPQYYEWDFNGVQWRWSLPMAAKDYITFRHKERPSGPWQWVALANDPDDDIYINQAVEYFEQVAWQEGFSNEERLNFVLAFVQDLPYKSDIITAPYDEYPRYPVETLFDHGGDCEDTSILAASLLSEMGYDVVLLELIDANGISNHMALGINLPMEHGKFFQFRDTDRRYFYVETTGGHWKIGDIPSEYRGELGRICPITRE